MTIMGTLEQFITYVVKEVGSDITASKLESVNKKVEENQTAMNNTVPLLKTISSRNTDWNQKLALTKERLKEVDNQMIGFRGDLLSVSFLLGGIGAGFSALLAPAAKATNIMEIFSAALEVLFIPIMLKVLPVVISFMNIISALPEPIKLLIGALVLGVAIFATVGAVIAGLALGVLGLITSLTVAGVGIAAVVAIVIKGAIVLAAFIALFLAFVIFGDTIVSFLKILANAFAAFFIGVFAIGLTWAKRMGDILTAPAKIAIKSAEALFLASIGDFTGAQSKVDEIDQVKEDLFKALDPTTFIPQVISTYNDLNTMFTDVLNTVFTGISGTLENKGKAVSDSLFQFGESNKTAMGLVSAGVKSETVVLKSAIDAYQKEINRLADLNKTPSNIPTPSNIVNVTPVPSQLTNTPTPSQVVNTQPTIQQTNIPVIKNTPIAESVTGSAVSESLSGLGAMFGAITNGITNSVLKNVNLALPAVPNQTAKYSDMVSYGTQPQSSFNTSVNINNVMSSGNVTIVERELNKSISSSWFTQKS